MIPTCFRFIKRPNFLCPPLPHYFGVLFQVTNRSGFPAFHFPHNNLPSPKIGVFYCAPPPGLRGACSPPAGRTSTTSRSAARGCGPTACTPPSTPPARALPTESTPLRRPEVCSRKRRPPPSGLGGVRVFSQPVSNSRASPPPTARGIFLQYILTNPSRVRRSGCSTPPIRTFSRPRGS